MADDKAVVEPPLSEEFEPTAKSVKGRNKQIVAEKEKGRNPQPGDMTPADAHPEVPSEAELKAADANLPVYDEEKASGGAKLPDTPSGYALKKVGNLDGEDVD